MDEMIFSLSVAYMVFINFTMLILMVWDKISAIKGRDRVPEKLLFTTSFIGGAIACGVAMLLVRHKIRKIKFLILVPLFAILNVAGFVAINYLV